jgi:Skp family chaperone for outer membrane proteins
MESFRRAQKVLDRRQEELYETLVRIRIDRDRGEDVREREAALRRQMEMVQAEYQQLQAELMVQEERRAAPIYTRLRQALPQLATAHHVDKIAESPPAPRGNGPVTDLTSELIRAVDAQPPLPGEAAK